MSVCFEWTKPRQSDRSPVDTGRVPSQEICRLPDHFEWAHASGSAKNSMPLVITRGPPFRVIAGGDNDAGDTQSICEMGHSCIIADEQSGSCQERGQGAEIRASSQIQNRRPNLPGDRAGQMSFSRGSGEYDLKPSSREGLGHLGEPVVGPTPRRSACSYVHTDVAARPQSSSLGKGMERSFILVAQGEFQFLTQRVHPKEFKEAQHSAKFQTVIGVRQETIRIGTILSGLKESSCQTRPQKHGERVGDRSPAMHLDDQVESLLLDLIKKARDALHLWWPLRQAWIAGELPEPIQVHVVSSNERLGPRETDQDDLGLWQCRAKRPKRRDGAQEVAQL
jgi:hypothetical protein